jgi:hypothetical protein
MGKECGPRTVLRTAEPPVNKLAPRLIAVLACGFLIAASLAAQSRPADARDLFSMIFGGRHFRPMAPWEHPARPRVRRARPVVSEGREAAAESYKVDPADIGTLNLFLNDRTLARGDIVVTSSGFQVFRGSATFPHSPSDFVPLRAANLRNLAQLKALEATVSTANAAIDEPDPKVAGAKMRRR